MANIIFYLETQAFIYFTFQYHSTTHYACFNKKHNTLLVFTNNITNDVTFDEFLPMTITADKDEFIGLIQPFSLLRSLEPIASNLAPKKMDSATRTNFIRIKTLANNMTKLSNPVLVTFTFK